MGSAVVTYQNSVELPAIVFPEAKVALLMALELIPKAGNAIDAVP
jgi:hypothetical protein